MIMAQPLYWTVDLDQSLSPERNRYEVVRGDFMTMRKPNAPI